MMQYERQAITSTVRLPRHPGEHATVVKCKNCDNRLGIVGGGYLFVRHKGRETTCQLPAEVRCEECGQRTMLDRT